MNIAELIIDLYTNLLFFIKKISQKNNLSSSQLLCIYAIPNEGISQSNLAKILCLDLSTLSRNLDKLIIKKIVRKESSKSDYRKQNIFLTNKGEKIHLLLLNDLNVLLQQLNGWDNQANEDFDLIISNLSQFNWLLHKNRYINV